MRSPLRHTTLDSCSPSKGTMYEPRRIVVLGLQGLHGLHGLAPDATPEAVLEFFAEYGEVTDVVVKVQPNNVYAFVEFASEDVMLDVLRRERFLFGGQVVRVLRAYKPRRLPSRPFPGMDARTSPVRVAMREGLLHDQPTACLDRFVRSIWAM